MSDLALKNCSSVIKVVSNISEKFQKQLIQLAVASFQNKPIDIGGVSFDEKEIYTNEQICDLFGLYVTLIKIFVHTKKEEFEETLLQGGFSQDFVDRFPVKQENKMVITESTNLTPNLSSLRWGIDISLNDSVLKRKVPPWVLFNITLDSGKQYTFVADIHLFHKMRFNIAMILKELNNLKQTSIVRK